MSGFPFATVLVANRGEIALRVIRTLRVLGLKSVAVYSDADAGQPHVEEADVAVRIGPAPARDSYLSIPALLEAAQSRLTEIHGAREDVLLGLRINGAELRAQLKDKRPRRTLRAMEERTR